MSLRQAAKRWLPPAALDLVRAVRRGGEPSEWEYCPDGWGAVEPETLGWNVQSIVEAQQRTWPEFVRLASGCGPLGINHTDLVPSAEDAGAHNTIMAFGYV